MIKLPKQQRLEAYKWARTEIIQGREKCICIALDNYLMVNYNVIWWGLGLEFYQWPELIPHKPTMLKDGDKWFPSEDRASRVSVLNRIIEKMEKEVEV